MTLWYGFKKHAAWIAGRVRQRLGVGTLAPLNVEDLARCYNVDVVRLSDLSDATPAAAHFQGPAGDRISGLVLPVDDRHMMIYNDGHALERIRSTFTHEASHIVLHHEHRVRIIGTKECAAPNRDQEDEAAELGAELLIPRQAALSAVLNEMSADALAASFGTSAELADWRMNISGGRQIKKRRAG